jgi:hypothetical protein
LSGATPFSYLITDLTPGTRYYVRVAAHNTQGFGYGAVTDPEYQIPTYNPPGAPPPVRLYASTAYNITVEWSSPRENGGATVMGYELWMDDWAGGNPRLVFDGTDQPDVTSFTVDSTSSFPVESGKSYRFLVRAINYCIANNNNTACVGPFSTPAVFAVRTPRVSLPPAMPYRSSKSNDGTNSSGDATIYVRWRAPIDNGGSPITSYSLYYAAPGSATYTEKKVNYPEIDSANEDQVFEAYVDDLKEGSVYRFYVVAVNSIGRSAGSPILTVVAGRWPGIDYHSMNVYSGVNPKVTAVESTQITLSWPMPSSNSTGSIPITGYKLYMFPGVGLNTLANPVTVLNEIQVIKTSVSSKYSTNLCILLEVVVLVVLLV